MNDEKVSLAVTYFYDVEVNQHGTYWTCKTKKRLHRHNGPAIESSNGTKEWFENGVHHRKDGPAVECVNGEKEWWLNGMIYSEAKYKELTQPDPCAGKMVEIDGRKYKLVPIE